MAAMSAGGVEAKGRREESDGSVEEERVGCACEREGKKGVAWCVVRGA